MKQIFNKISSNLKSKFYYDYNTSNNVWFRTGGKVAVFCLVYDQNELEIILNSIGDIPYTVIGAGSNILVRDKGYNGVLFKLGKKFNKIDINESYINVGAGILDVNLSKFALKKSIKNFEFYSGIPGTIGGAIKMNAGCFDCETKDLLIDVKIINPNGKVIIKKKEEINLSYRSSEIIEKDIIISANFISSYGNEEEILSKMEKIKFIRENSQPIKSKTSGSTFKNPKNNFAAKLIERSGCKDLNVGDAYVSTKHANFLINMDNASASEIEELGKIIIDRVYNQFDIRLEWEIKIIGN